MILTCLMIPTYVCMDVSEFSNTTSFYDITEHWIDNNPPSYSTNLIIGGIKVISVDEEGGNFYISEHGVTVTVPKMAISAGMVAKMKFAATLVAPVQFSDNTVPLSPIIWLCMNAKLHKPIQIQLPHYVNIKSSDHSKTLQFAKATVHSMENNAIGSMEIIEGGYFPVGKSYGIIEIDHFCYYCILSVQSVDIPDNLYQVVTMKEIQPNISQNLWIIHVCIIPSLPTCLKVYITIQYILMYVHYSLNT